MSQTVSVVILTRNRSALLADCLDALGAQSRPADEIVLLDNGSTDSTPEVIARFAQSLPVRAIRGEPEAAWATARNLGIEAATSDWIAFTDDDCVPAPDWLEVIEQQANQGLEAIGGVVLPRRPLPRPWWWHSEMSWAVGLLPPAQSLKSQSESNRYPSTSNWATRRSVLLAKPFQEIPASRGKKRLYQGGREDAELWRRLRLGGYRCRFVAELRVEHQVGPERFAARALLRRAFNDGVALQRREPNDRLLDQALDTLTSSPEELLCRVWSGPESPAREIALRLFWAARQLGQCRQTVRAQGLLQGARVLFTRGARASLRNDFGTVKRIARPIGIAALRLTRPPKQAAERQERSIVIAAMGFLGDMFLLHPFIVGLKASRPEVEITLLTNAIGESIYRHDPAVRQIFIVGQKDKEKEKTKAIRSALHASQADLILTPYFHNAPPRALFSRPQARVVAFSEQVGFPRQWWYDRLDTRVAKPEGSLESDNLHRLFREAGFQGTLPESQPAFLPDELDEIARWTQAQQLDADRFVIIAPGSGQPEKLWVAERWGEVLNHLVVNRALKVVLMGSPSEQPLCRRIQESAPPPADAILWPSADPRQAALLAGQARLVLCCDSGAKHMAVAMDTPTLALFGPSDERQWGPIRSPRDHQIVRACVRDLTGEERAAIPPDHQMRAIQTHHVITTLDKMLQD